MLQRDPGQQVLPGGLGPVAGDAEDDELEGVRLGGVDVVQKFFGGRDLRSPGVMRRERQLTRQGRNAVDAELRHAGHYLGTLPPGQGC